MEMAYLVIRTFTETVDRDKNLGSAEHPWYAVNRGDFVEKSCVSYKSTETPAQLVMRARKTKSMDFDHVITGGFQTKKESVLGIRSYQRVTIEDRGDDAIRDALHAIGGAMGKATFIHKAHG